MDNMLTVVLMLGSFIAGLYVGWDQHRRLLAGISGKKPAKIKEWEENIKKY